MNSQGEPGPAILIEELVKAAKKESPQTRAAAMGLLQTLCSKGSVDLTEHVPHLIIFTTEALNDPSDRVCERAWLSLEALVKVLEPRHCGEGRTFIVCVCVFSMQHVNPKQLPHYIGYLRKGLKTVSNMLIGEELHGFSLKVNSCFFSLLSHPPSLVLPSLTASSPTVRALLHV